ncbi:MAG: Na+/H+ antiporter subunit E [Phenylobacterium sp.]|nr:Na+/H+ antiporter subunit E [Phenylobacterium sp.]
MRRFLPHPLLSLGLFIASLLLSASTGPPALALATLAAILAPLMLRTFGMQRVRIRSPRAILQLTGMVLADILRSNLAVGQILLSGKRRERTSGFIHVPLDLKDRQALAVLAIILTSTPGTLWVEYERATGRLLVHVLDLVDEETWIQLIKGRYERLLLEIFE